MRVFKFDLLGSAKLIESVFKRFAGGREGSRRDQRPVVVPAVEEDDRDRLETHLGEKVFNLYKEGSRTNEATGRWNGHEAGRLRCASIQLLASRSPRG